MWVCVLVARQPIEELLRKGLHSYRRVVPVQKVSFGAGMMHQGCSLHLKFLNHCNQLDEGHFVWLKQTYVPINLTCMYSYK